jgi:hypothetical protein
MLQNAVANFANDLNLISDTIKSRTVQQVRFIFSNYSDHLKTRHLITRNILFTEKMTAGH